MVECLSGKNENLGSDSQHPHRSWAAAGVGWPSHSVSWLNSARVLVSETKQTTIEVALWSPHADVRAHGHKPAHMLAFMPVFIL